MTLSREMRHDLNKWLLPRLLLPLLMVAVALLLILTKQSDTAEEVANTAHRIEMDTVRSELSDIDHRIKQEMCVIGPIGQIVRQRIHDRTDARIDICNPDDALPDLTARRDRLEQRLREMGAFEVRDE